MVTVSSTATVAAKEELSTLFIRLDKRAECLLNIAFCPFERRVSFH